MSEGFLYTLGEFKAKQSGSNFTKSHNETYFQIARKLGAQACHFYTALSTYEYGSKVVAFPKIATLAQRLGVSERTIVRWTRQLETEKIIRSVPTYQLDGARWVNVVILNAMHPEIPDNWDTFAPDIDKH